MRKVLFHGLVALFLCGTLSTTFAQDSSAFEEDGWKRRFASPTYGAALAPLTVKYGTDEEDEIMVPGVELRIFNGINVGKRGNFYTGYEVGVSFHFLGESDSYEGATSSAKDYSLKEFFSGMVFLMSKYGYRFGLGTKAGGLTVGPVIGIGIGMGGGSVDIYDINNETSSGADTEMIFGPMLEAAVEGSLRTGQNFRFVGIVGVNVSPGMEWDDSEVSGEMVPVRPDIRFGFVQNY